MGWTSTSNTGNGEHLKILTSIRGMCFQVSWRNSISLGLQMQNEVLFGGQSLRNQHKVNKSCKHSELWALSTTKT